MSLRIIQDGITPDLLRRAAQVADKRPMLLAMGLAVTRLGVASFTDAGKRAAYWAPRKNPEKLLKGQTKPHALLQLNTDLRKSLRGDEIHGDTVMITSHLPYAATHQFGRMEEGIPARPFLPFYPNGMMTPLGTQRVERALKAALKARGM